MNNYLLNPAREKFLTVFLMELQFFKEKVFFPLIEKFSFSFFYILHINNFSIIKLDYSFFCDFGVSIIKRC